MATARAFAVFFDAVIVGAAAALLFFSSVIITAFGVAVCVLRARGWGESSNDRERAVVEEMGAGDDGEQGIHLGHAGHGDVSDEGARALM